MAKIAFNEKVQFKDREGNIFKVKAELKREKEGFVFSASGSWGGGCGQCLDYIKPDNKYQKELIALWHEYHLNGMNAGTEKQEKALRRLKNRDYDRCVKYLKKKKLYTDNGYRYGSGWRYRPLPKDMKNKLVFLFDNIRKEEAKKREGQALVFDYLSPKLYYKEAKDKLIKDFGKKILALAIYLKLTIEEMREIDKGLTCLPGDNRFLYGGIDYFVGTENEAHDEAKRHLTDDIELWKQAVQAGYTTESLEDWAETVINADGYGYVLNSWDGSEDEQELNGTVYFIIRT